MTDRAVPPGRAWVRLSSLVMPKRPRQHQLEVESRAAIRTAIPPVWVYRDLDQDYGIDGEVEIFDSAGLATGTKFLVQLKATDATNLGKALRLWFTLENSGRRAIERHVARMAAATGGPRASRSGLSFARSSMRFDATPGPKPPSTLTFTIRRLPSGTSSRSRSRRPREPSSSRRGTCPPSRGLGLRRDDVRLVLFPSGSSRHVRPTLVDRDLGPGMRDRELSGGLRIARIASRGSSGPPVPGGESHLSTHDRHAPAAARSSHPPPPVRPIPAAHPGRPRPGHTGPAPLHAFAHLSQRRRSARGVDPAAREIGRDGAKFGFSSAALADGPEATPEENTRAPERSAAAHRHGTFLSPWWA